MRPARLEGLSWGLLGRSMSFRALQWCKMNPPTGRQVLRFADLGFTLLYGSRRRLILSGWNARMCPYSIMRTHGRTPPFCGAGSKMARRLDFGYWRRQGARGASRLESDLAMRSVAEGLVFRLSTAA